MTFRFRINFTIADIVPQITLISHVKFKYFLLMHKNLKQVRNNSVYFAKDSKIHSSKWEVTAPEKL